MNRLLSGPDLFLREMRELGVDVSRETRDQLEALVNTLGRWQKAINLVGRATVEDVWIRHVLDSAQLKVLIPQTARSLTDLGSGGGFPGLVVAALCPDLEVTLIEADARKAAFLGEAARRMELKTPPRIVIGRIEQVPSSQAEIITARALAPLAQLLAWADHHRTDTAICLFHKGKDWRAELTEAMKDWDIESQPLSSVTDRDAVILRINSYRKPSGRKPSGTKPSNTKPSVRDRQPEGRRR